MTCASDPSTEAILGVDTHADFNVGFTINGLGQILDTTEVPANRAGHRELLRWTRRQGRFERCGIEGTGSYGAGLCRYLIDAGIDVIEVDRPNRQRRRRRGKSDTTDAEAAARAVLAGEATTIPKDRTGRVEALRMIRNCRRSAVKAKTQTANQIKDLIATAPDEIKDQLSGLTTPRRVKTCAAWRPGPATPMDPTSSARYSLHRLAKRWLDLDAEIAEHDQHLKTLTRDISPNLVAEYGVGAVTAAELLIAAGENPDRMRTEAAYAALCGTSPVDASTGKQQHHRLNRGGNRQANSALYTIALTRWRGCPETAAYIAKQRAQGRTDRHIRRCIKRALARRFHHIITKDLTRPLT